jgi:ATP-dependent Lon protease
MVAKKNSQSEEFETVSDINPDDVIADAEEARGEAEGEIILEIAPTIAVTTETPVLPVRDTVLFPHMVAPLFVGREKSVKAIEEAMTKDRQIIVVAQRQPDTQDVSFEDVYTIGTEATIGRVLKMPDGTTSVLVQGQRRVRLLRFLPDESAVKA